MAKHKYGAVPTTVDGIRFASLKESRRYSELRLLERAGEIHLLQLQPTFALVVVPVGTRSPETRIGEYRADFAYCQCFGGVGNCGWSRVVVEDVKGMKTPVYRLKKKFVEAQYGISIREV